jgi:pilus assembly protein Flp/PilA
MLTPVNIDGVRVLFCRLLREESAQDLIEYALLSAFIGLAGIAAFNGISGAIGSWYGQSNTNLNGIWESPEPAP